ncbi:hypothetical protein PtrSN002B_008576 [Pyrenophora tritici-repentis]|uniref:Uncharacterized protein n=2 Tax=Pyrenophora tritici-repentis TaxID=45151 RepID=A0A2W1D3Z8_9PLEO|nr:uncharacterized protein PTRG_01777 [Pyrenophora tritici-repentis Pt-1C-BFP]KAA8626479.1 COX7a domain-containing protein [Pyrenophora tritici-repentis]EDU41215.1 hypothetical protein PTRG_01777 [Pyrenophora tritici-repentis Pt-1C-BFP]KAF7454901.1 COX7a domain containing protein [Pyrenophora tritici-repentis]KAF7578050.1 hypothetical protein PtrM4_022900 [Pyrenophora tritici-repentis]KAI0569607.1 COX7a domain-containing protein [Pyrenophora tritici-repentis]
MAGWVMRENRVPYWQREHQKHDGLRTWEKARGKWMIPGYKVLLFGSLSASMYMMGRLVLGHKTWFGKN